MSMQLSTFKTLFGITKPKTNTECLHYFDGKHIAIAYCMLVKKVLPKHLMVIFEFWKVVGCIDIAVLV